MAGCPLLHVPPCLLFSLNLNMSSHESGPSHGLAPSGGASGGTGQSPERQHPVELCESGQEECREVCASLSLGQSARGRPGPGPWIPKLPGTSYSEPELHKTPGECPVGPWDSPCRDRKVEAQLPLSQGLGAALALPCFLAGHRLRPCLSASQGAGCWVHLGTQCCRLRRGLGGAVRFSRASEHGKGIFNVMIRSRPPLLPCDFHLTLSGLCRKINLSCPSNRIHE